MTVGQHISNSGNRTSKSSWAVWSVLAAFVIACVFDPADRIFGGKVPLFFLAWIVTLGSLLIQGRRVEIAGPMVLYVSIFITIPVLSICWYYVIDGQSPYEGYAMLKGYLLISFAILLALNKIDLLPLLCAALAVLAVTVVMTFIALTCDPDLYNVVKATADAGGLLILDKRSYSDQLVLLQVYFVTSPMLVIAIAFYFDRAVMVESTKSRVFYLGLTAISVIGLLLAGTRNNIIVSLLLPFLLWPFYTRRPLFYSSLSFGILLALALPFVSQLGTFFDPAEAGNSIKLAALNDYFSILSNPATLLLGRGLGSYEVWTERGPFYVTELTYLEILRNFGIIGGLVMMFLLLVPVIQPFVVKGSSQSRSVAIAFFFYLLMCISNPNLFSSMGVLILAILVSNALRRRHGGGIAKVSMLGRNSVRSTLSR